jgi:hypothetical protein
MTTPFQATQTFVPTQIPGCQLWFDAADQTTFTYSSGTSISQWRDKSSNAYSVIQATASNQPTLTSGAQNRLPGIQFSQSTYLYQTATSMPAFTTGGSTSVLMAARNASTNDGWNIINTIWFDINALTATQRYHFSFNQNTTDGTTLYTNNTFVGQVTSNAVAPSANAILGFTASATSQTIHTNGSTDSYAGTTLPDATGNTDFIFNDPRNDNLASANTMIFEMVGYNTQITTAQRQQLEGYLAWKWGMVGNLPASHPYKTTPIISLPPFPNAPRGKYATQVSLFQPTNLNGCYLWLDASIANNFTFSSGSNISTWIDRSGNSYTATAANNPTYDSVNKRVRFLNASSQYMSNTSAPLSLAQRSFFFVIEDLTYVAVGGYMPMIPNPTSGTDYTTTTGMTIENNVGFKFYGNSGGYDNRIVGAAAPNAKGIYSEVFRNQSGTAYLNGTANGTSNASYLPGTSSGYALGARWIGGISAPYINAYYYEVLVYNTALSVTQRQQIEGYLAWKWNLQGSLPSTHPYKNTPVYAQAPFPLVPRILYATNKYFNPNSITGCSLWLDAADPATVTLTGSSVTGVLDKSSSNVTLSNASGFTYPNNTFNGRRPSFFVNGGGNSGGGTQRLGANATFALPTPFTVSFVCQHVGAANYGYILDSANGSGRPYIIDGGIGGNTFATPFNPSGGGLSATSPLLNNFVFGPSSVAFQNGTQQFTGNSGTFTMGGILVGNRFTLNESWPGHICELIIHNTALTTSQRQQVEGYLAWKWGLQSNLPANHPFKLFPPSPS